MIKVIELTKEYHQAWDKYVLDSPDATISHLRRWSEIFPNSLGHEPKYYIAVEDGVVKGIAPLCLVKAFRGKKYLVSLPWIDYGGICADSPEIEKLIAEKLKELTDSIGAEFLELRTEKATLGLAERTDKVTFLLKLEDDPEVLFKRLDGKLRNQIRKSFKSELEMNIGSVENLDEFYKVFCRNMRDLGTPVWGKDFYYEILTKLPDNAKIILVKKDNKTIAGGLILSFKDRLYVPSASSYREALKYCPNHGLYWEVIKNGCESGHKYFDFGRSSWESNTFRFKKQWVSDPTQLTWQYYMPSGEDIPAINPNNPKYKMAINLWKKLPLPIANYLGPKVIKNFP